MSNGYNDINRHIRKAEKEASSDPPTMQDDLSSLDIPITKNSSSKP